MELLSILPIVMGIFIASQTSINARLSHYTKLPLLSSTVSFFVGALFLLLINLLSHNQLNIPPSTLISIPWWAWLGGFTAAFALTSNILLFKHLGSIQATLYPIVGQIIMSLLIDQFGWFASPISKLNWIRVVGAILMIVGLVIFIDLPSSVLDQHQAVKADFIWQGIGLLAGVALAIQNAVNAKLGSSLSLPLKASLIAFCISFIVLLCINIILRIHIGWVIRTSIKQSLPNEWWIWLGGVLGSSYVALSSVLVPRLGTGQVVIVALFGQLVFSALIQQFGWFKSPVYPITRPQIIGTIVMFIGIVLIKLG